MKYGARQICRAPFRTTAQCAGGAYRLNDTTTMVVSCGLARESTPLPRFFNHPEIVVIDIKPR